MLAWAAWLLQCSPTAWGTLGKHFTKPFPYLMNNPVQITTKDLGKNEKNVFGPFGWGHCPSGAVNEGYSTPQIPWYFTEKPTHPQIGVRNRTPEKESNKSRQNKRRTNWNSIGQFRHLGSGSRSLPFPMGGKRVGGS